MKKLFFLFLVVSVSVWGGSWGCGSTAQESVTVNIVATPSSLTFGNGSGETQVVIFQVTVTNTASNEWVIRSGSVSSGVALGIDLTLVDADVGTPLEVANKDLNFNFTDASLTLLTDEIPVDAADLPVAEFVVQFTSDGSAVGESRGLSFRVDLSVEDPSPAAPEASTVSGNTTVNVGIGIDGSAPAVYLTCPSSVESTGSTTISLYYVDSEADVSYLTSTTTYVGTDGVDGTNPQTVDMTSLMTGQSGTVELPFSTSNLALGTTVSLVLSLTDDEGNTGNTASCTMPVQ